MKKGFYAILTALTVFALVMTGCPEAKSDDPPPPPPPVTKPDLGTGVSGGGSFTTTTTSTINLRVVVSNLETITAANIKYEWFSATSETADGTAIANSNNRDYAPPKTSGAYVVGTTWYWVVVTNTATSEFTASAKVRVQIYVPPTDSAVEYILAANAAMPLWEFTLPTGTDWVDYEEFSIDYYVSKFSIIADPAVTVRSRLYGAYVAEDFITPDKGDAQGWGEEGTEVNPGAFRMVSWNGTDVKRKDAAGADITGINPNNDFIIDNARGTAAVFTAMFTAESGAASKWFTVKYATNAGMAKDFAKVTLLDKSKVETIYVGAGIFGPSGDAANNYEFYVKNPTLLHKVDPTKNIRGLSNKTGTTELLFAGNKGSNKGATTRSVLAPTDDYEDVAGQIQVSFDLDGGTGSFTTLKLTTGDTLPASFFNSANASGYAVDPMRASYTFDGWFTDAETPVKVVSTTTFTATLNPLKAKWTAAFVKVPFNVDLTGVTLKNTAAWTAQYSAGLVLPMGSTFDPSLGYDNLVIVCKFYDATDAIGSTAPENGNFQLKYFAAEPDNANSASPASLATAYNFGNGGTVDSSNVVTLTLPIAAAAKTSFKYLAIQSSSGIGTPATYPYQYVEVVSITATFNP